MIDARLSDDELARMLAGLPARHAATLVNGTRPAVRFAVSTEPLEAPVPVGITRFGGEPDLPADVAWPTWVHPGRSGRSRPLSFFVQIDLSSVAGGTDLALPADGLLLFFCDLGPDGRGTWGLHHDEHAGSRVLHVPAAGLRRRVAPAGTHSYQENLLRPVLVTTTPDVLALGRLEEDDGPEDDLDYVTYDQFDRRVEDHILRAMPAGWVPSGRHQLGGHPRAIQLTVEARCLQAASNIVRRDGSLDLATWDRVKDQADQWRLLFQLDSDYLLSAMWGDAGTLYWAAHRDHLRSHRWDQVWFTFQCC